MNITKRQLLVLTGLVILLIAIPVTFYLVRQTQVLKSRASFTTTLQFVDDADTNRRITESTSHTVKLKVTRTEVSVSPSPAVSSSPVQSPNPSPSSVSSPSPASSVSPVPSPSPVVSPSPAVSPSPVASPSTSPAGTSFRVSFDQSFPTDATSQNNPAHKTYSGTIDQVSNRALDPVTGLPDINITLPSGAGVKTAYIQFSDDGRQTWYPALTDPSAKATITLTTQ